MKLNKLHRLAMAVAAVGLLAGGVSKAAVSTEISASTFVTNLQQYVQNGDIAAAKDALQQLKSFGIKHIKIGDEMFLIDDVLVALDDPTQANLMITRLVASVNSGLEAYFVAENRVVASVDWSKTPDLFPTSSAG